MSKGLGDGAVVGAAVVAVGVAADVAGVAADGIHVTYAGFDEVEAAGTDRGLCARAAPGV